MAAWLNRYGGPVAAALLVLLVGGAMLLGWQRWQRDYEVTVEEDGSAVTKVIADRLGEHTGQVTNAFSNRSPSLAKRSMFGVLHCVFLPVYPTQ